jgi:hypothetical protein
MRPKCNVACAQTVTFFEGQQKDPTWRLDQLRERALEKLSIESVVRKREARKDVIKRSLKLLFLLLEVG